MSSPEPGKLATRSVGHIHPYDGATILVEHVYAPEGTCEDCGGVAHDHGDVGLTIVTEDEDVAILMPAEDALALANRLTRAANLVYESAEDVPDVEREAARFEAARKP